MKKKVEKPSIPAVPTKNGNGNQEDFIDMEEGFQSPSAYNNNKTSSPNEQEFNDEVFGDDLEVPYTEIDD
jgi:hypothetical protein